MSDPKETKQPEKLPPLRALPNFSRRLLRPTSSNYEKSELGTPLKSPTSQDQAKEAPIELRRRTLGQPKVPTSNMSSMNIGSSKSKSSPASASGSFYTKPRFKQVVKSTSYPNDSQMKEVKEYLSQELLGNDLGSEDEDENPPQRLEIPGLVPRLLAHQVVGVNFLSRRERARKYARGGILADDMGLGKTLQSIALILHCKPPKSNERVSMGEQATLVVSPLTVMDQWKDEIGRMAPKLRVTTHQGSKRTTNARTFANYDVVITTYDVVSSEHAKSGDSPVGVFQTPWYRIIADEAHTFRNPETRVAKAMAALRSEGRRWALTGTPLHNSIEDVVTLLRFIGIPSEQDLGSVHQMKPVLKAVMLRRTQRVLHGALPAIEIEKRGIKLDKRELGIYSNFSKRLSMKGENRLGNLICMRLACDGIASYGGRKVDVPQESLREPSSNDQETDAIDDKSGQIDETDALAAMLGSMSLTKPDSEKDSKYWGHDNSKVQALREIMLKKKTRQTVVFSSFVTMLHALRPMLDHEGISYEMYDGSMRAPKRQAVLEKFKKPHSGTTVLLCSLHAAAVGLNLANASQVVIIEPWWNPQIIDQAVKRVHRLGQKNIVNCVELYAADTLEERVMLIQDLKRKRAKDMLDDSEKLSKEEREFIMYGDSADSTDDIKAALKSV